MDIKIASRPLESGNLLRAPKTRSRYIGNIRCATESSSSA